MKKIFYIECSGAHWKETAVKLKEEYQWQPIYWTASTQDSASIKETFPDILFQSSVDASKHVVPNELLTIYQQSDACIDNVLMEQLASTQCHALHMMDRMDAKGNNFPYRARLKHYHNLVEYWLKILDFYKPDIIIFSISPHMAFDLIIYALAHYLGIRTLMFERTALPKSLYVIDDFRSKPVNFLKAYQQNLSAKELRMSDDVKAFLTASRSIKNNVPINFQKKMATFKLNKSSKHGSIFTLLKWCMFELKRAAYTFYKYGCNSGSTHHYVTYHSHKGLTSASMFELQKGRFQALYKKFKLKKHYANLCEKKSFDASKPYIFLALHYQPERATLPLGDFYASQELIVDLVASKLPKGWQLAIKEHPWQLQPYSRGELQREQVFYDHITRHNNVAIIPLEMDSNQLIAGAKAVATITGSVGWQAICQSIPCLSFGHNWYRICEGVFNIVSEDDLVVALSTIQQSNYIVDQKKIDAFAVALESISVQAVLEFSIEYTDGLNESVAAESMAAALYHFVQNKEG